MEEGQWAEVSTDVNSWVRIELHASFCAAGLFWEIVDQGSTNGVFVNGQRVVNTRLQTGDRIEIGRAVLVFQER